MQRAAVHAQAAGGLGDVAITLLIDALDVFPPDAIGGHRELWRGWQQAITGQQRGFNYVGVCGLGQVVVRAQLYRGDGRSNVAVAGQHHHPAVRAGFCQRRDHIEAVAVFEPQVDHGESGGIDRGGFFAVLDRVGGHGFEPAPLERARQPFGKACVVIHDQQAAIHVTLQRLGFVRLYCNA